VRRRGCESGIQAEENEGTRRKDEKAGSGVSETATGGGAAMLL
jgi:hypothetical protein